MDSVKQHVVNIINPNQKKPLATLILTVVLSHGVITIINVSISKRNILMTIPINKNLFRNFIFLK